MNPLNAPVRSTVAELARPTNRQSSYSPLWAGLVEACRAEGLPFESAELVHLGHGAGFVFPAQRLFVKAGGLEDYGRTYRAVLVSHRLKELGLPVLAPLAEYPQPRRTEYGPFSFWPLLEATDEPVDFAWLGATVRRLHETPSAGFPRAGRTSRHTLQRRRDAFFRKVHDAALERAVDAVIAELNRCTEALQDCEMSLIHGDVYPANIMTAAGRTWLLDFDNAGIGYRLLDLVTLHLAHKRFGLSGRSLDAFTAGYGEDAREHPLFATVLRLRELGLVTWLLIFGADLPAHRAELDHRLSTLHVPELWTDLGAPSDVRSSALWTGLLERRP